MESVPQVREKGDKILKVGNVSTGEVNRVNTRFKSRVDSGVKLNARSDSGDRS